MIICHPLKLIYIKTKKVASTSFEIALSKFCGDKCVLTPISPADEKYRVSLGYKGAQNFERHYWPDYDFQSKVSFYNHVRAPIVKANVPAEIWKDYKKIAIFRNPFDVTISKFFWRSRKPEMTQNFDEFVRENSDRLDDNCVIAPFKGPAQLDHYLCYENLEAELKAIGLSSVYGLFKDINAKGNFRPNTGATIEDIYHSFPQTIPVIAEACKTEIDYFKYPLPT